MKTHQKSYFIKLYLICNLVIPTIVRSNTYNLKTNCLLALFFHKFQILKTTAKTRLLYQPRDHTVTITKLRNIDTITILHNIDTITKLRNIDTITKLHNIDTITKLCNIDTITKLRYIDKITKLRNIDLIYQTSVI